MSTREAIISYIEVLPPQNLEKVLACAKAEAEKAARNAEYLAKLDRSLQQLAEGRLIERDIIEVEEDE